jgi:hypothetical protein
MTMILGPSKAVLSGEAASQTTGEIAAVDPDAEAPEAEVAEAPKEREKPKLRDKSGAFELGSPEQLAD